MYRITGGELEAADVPVEHQRRDGRVAAQADAGERPGADDPLDVGGEAAIGWRTRRRGAQFDIVLSADTLPAAEPLIAALRTSAVQSSIDALGGYDLTRAGSVEMLT